jgi:coenzyme Q-binding protein COQ10
MPTHAEKRLLPYTPEKLYNLVSDVEKYPDFLPWCIALRVRSREVKMINADMIIGFKVFREKFTTRVTLNPPRRIDVEYLDGPFKYLNNHWIFKPIDDGACEIDFYVNFEFKSILLQKAIGAVFNEAVQKMINAFEARAHRIYGNQLKTIRTPMP